MGNITSKPTAAESRDFFHAVFVQDIPHIQQALQTFSLKHLHMLTSPLTIHPTPDRAIVVRDMTPLHAASLRTPNASFDLLLSHDFPVISNERGESPLHLAASRCDTYKIRALLQHFPELKGILFIIIYHSYFLF